MSFFRRRRSTPRAGGIDLSGDARREVAKRPFAPPTVWVCPHLEGQCPDEACGRPAGRCVEAVGS